MTRLTPEQYQHMHSLIEDSGLGDLAISQLVPCHRSTVERAREPKAEVRPTLEPDRLYEALRHAHPPLKSYAFIRGGLFRFGGMWREGES